jgi:hypothetical protein
MNMAPLAHSLRPPSSAPASVSVDAVLSGESSGAVRVSLCSGMPREMTIDPTIMATVLHARRSGMELQRHYNELLIRDAPHPYPDELVIATKGGFVRGGFDYTTLDAVGNIQYLRQSAHMSARRLDVDHIDLYYLHSGRACAELRRTVSMVGYSPWL